VARTHAEEAALKAGQGAKTMSGKTVSASTYSTAALVMLVVA
jgi:hypothetical protein